jgi:uncharacterized protein YndB with AHSA1/START domain
MTQEGTLVIADITGYTTYLNESELEHAQDSLTSLMELMVEDTKPPLVISRLEGDAVISYAPKGSIVQGQTLIEAIERSYIDFRQARKQMVLNTTCPCNACQNIPNLDLKFFLHYGTFGVQKIRDHEELVGSDVNLLFRMVKNSIPEKLGLTAYAALTEATVLGLAFGELAQRMQRHTEHDDDGEEVNLFVHDLTEAWNRFGEDSDLAVKPEEALLTLEIDFDLAPAQLWDYLTDPEYRKVIYGSDDQTITEQTDGRTGPGSVYVCSHGDSVTLQKIIDWRPFERFTSEDTTVLKGVTMRASNYLTPIDGGTHLSVSCSTSRGGSAVKGKVHDILAKQILRRTIPMGIERLKTKIDADREAGKIVHPEQRDVPSSAVRKAARQSLIA